MYRRGLLSALALAPALAGCNDTEPANGTPSEPTETPDERATVVDHELVRTDAGTDEEIVRIDGTVRIRVEGLQHVELRGRFFGETRDDSIRRSNGSGNWASARSPSRSDTPRRARPRRPWRGTTSPSRRSCNVSRSSHIAPDRSRFGGPP